MTLISRFLLRLQREGNEPAPPFPSWLPRLMAIEPQRVMFGHDLSIWEADA